MFAFVENRNSLFFLAAHCSLYRQCYAPNTLSCPRQIFSLFLYLFRSTHPISFAWRAGAAESLSFAISLFSFEWNKCLNCLYYYRIKATYAGYTHTAFRCVALLWSSLSSFFHHFHEMGIWNSGRKLSRLAVWFCFSWISYECVIVCMCLVCFVWRWTRWISSTPCGMCIDYAQPDIKTMRIFSHTGFSTDPTSMIHRIFILWYMNTSLGFYFYDIIFMWHNTLHSVSLRLRSP